MASSATVIAIVIVIIRSLVVSPQVASSPVVQAYLGVAVGVLSMIIVVAAFALRRAVGVSPPLFISFRAS
ncbi:hypothetical protein B0H19DRAFT_1155951 [Mycena capillaripes]|nr:hypothetical protein B0H19DRAFT_1155951 [Mycena capillaripes]